MSAESPPNTGDLPGSPLSRHPRRVSDPVSSAGMSASVTDTDDGASGIRGAIDRSTSTGLGLGMSNATPAPNGIKNRPAQLNLSPSDSNISTKAKGLAGHRLEEADEERAVVSEVSRQQFSYERQSKLGV